ncbi:hypothetical protein ANN_20996 [Periplaneta americana]|uniref:Uncharacterized protein n=1 Tax=Periplaneta americana TaxID=6978 RepID=A0ABQ8SFA7_PERAM|nr:hypothetical protein ANN_20996 [Periplaneta americana]
MLRLRLSYTSEFVFSKTLRGRTQPEIHELLRENCDSTEDRNTISRCSRRVCEVHMATEDNQRTGRLKSSLDFTTEVIVASVLEEDRRMACTNVVRRNQRPKICQNRLLSKFHERIPARGVWFLRAERFRTLRHILVHCAPYTCDDCPSLTGGLGVIRECKWAILTQPLTEAGPISRTSSLIRPRAPSPY